MELSDSRWYMKYFNCNAPMVDINLEGLISVGHASILTYYVYGWVWKEGVGGGGGGGA